MSSQTKILILALELADYFLSGINALANKDNVEITLIHWPVNKDAPFKIKINSKIESLEKGKFKSKSEKLVESTRADIVYIAGWVDKDYKRWARKFKKKGIPVLMGLDNQWKGSLKQIIGCMFSSFLIHRYCTHIWCAGNPQVEFARNMGFKESQILKGLYTANVAAFYQKEMMQKKKSILFVGRFLDWKGVEELYKSFNDLNLSDWELKMIGNGPMQNKFESKNNVKICEFIQPIKLVSIIQEAAVFCLPSWEENWGVVVHEAAAAGCAIVVSDGVGAGTAFVKHGQNGYIFPSRNTKALKACLLKITQLSSFERQKMAYLSRKMALQNTPELWAKTLLSVKK